jgi:hypothetical protein
MPVNAQTDEAGDFIPLPAKSLAADSTNAIRAIAAKCEYVNPSLSMIFARGRKSRFSDTERTVFTLSAICDQFHTFLQHIGVFS